MKFETKILIGCIVSVFVFLVYFATQVSAVYPPIKSYQFTLTKDELRGQLIEIINSIPGSTLSLTDSTGPRDDRSYYYDIMIQDGTHEFKYNIKYENENSFWDSSIKSHIALIGAFDDRLRTGGYKIEDRDVDKLKDYFEKTVITKIK